MKQELSGLIRQALIRLEDKGDVPAGTAKIEIQIERTRQKSHGDFASNVSLALAKRAGKNPRELAEKITHALPETNKVKKVEIAGPGFINFFVDESQAFASIKTVLEQTDRYGQVNIGNRDLITVEFVSANPTGPLHVGHGRGAAFGDSLSRLLTFAGFQVHREYYFNDAGRQMDILALSVWLRYLEQLGIKIEFPVNAYQGEYIKDIAASIAVNYGNDFNSIMDDFFATAVEQDEEAHLDQLIENMQHSLGQQNKDEVLKLCLDIQVKQIQDDLHEFRVDFDQWFSEGSLERSGAIDKALTLLKDQGHIYEKDGASWFRASEFGDEKDRVVIRKNGRHTYFAADIAYMVNKIDRGFKKLIYIWGADHHGTIARMRAAFQALGHDLDQFIILLVQMASLYRGGERVSMSTRRAEFVTLEQLRQEVGVDATRFFYNMRKNEQQMEFDLDLAKSQSNDNPVYYVQYAHARVCSIFRQAEEKQITMNAIEQIDLSHLNVEIEKDLATKLEVFPEVITTAARDFAPHQVTYYLRELAALFHSFYNQIKILDADDQTRQARLALVSAVQQVLKNGLTLIGVSAPEYM